MPATTRPHSGHEARTPAQVLAGDIPPEAAGVFFRHAERLLCRTHLTAEHLEHLGDEHGVVLFGFTDCDECWVEADARDVAIMREEDELAAAERLLERAGCRTWACDECGATFTGAAAATIECVVCGSVDATHGVAR